jgi:hypothetical protein
MILLALSLLQALSYQVPAPSSGTEQQADLSLRRADEGRALARRFLCQDKRRLDRLREMTSDLRFLKRGFPKPLITVGELTLTTLCD